MSRFDSVLVANRGEIAARVLRTAGDLGYRTVAVFSDADRDAPHVRLADEAVRLGPGPAGESYLDADRVLQAVERTGAGSVHPGYGFLAENADFAQRCADAGLVFIGPPVAAIRIMGDKVQAKRRMIEAHVPTAPGYLGGEQADEQLRVEAEALGVPLLVKAVAGGGGRGMRRVTDLGQLPEAIAGARGEARNAFGNGDLFLERLVTGARHIEVQVFADEYGNVIHLGERECSVQRRHQKIIEEAPSPVVDPALRHRLGEAAVAAARAIDYRGAGTVEFLVDDEGEFYFLEMNTRLQVEHPVTEIVTGVDLVAWQLAVAQGGPLPLTQADLELKGHAIEARLYAEDPAAGFLPQVGHVHVFDAPAGPHVRVDAGITAGLEISSYYDPMVAKIIGHGRSRADAIRALVGALRRTTLLGVATNRGFLVRLVSSPEFEAAQFKTDTLDRGGFEAFTGPQGPSAETWAVGAALRVHGLGDGWRSTGASWWPITVAAGEAERSFVVERVAGHLVVRGDEDERGYEVHIHESAPPQVRLEVDGVRRLVLTHATPDGLHLLYRGETVLFTEPTAAATHESGPADGQVRAPIGGKVLTVDVAAGARVETGQRLLTVEAMKIEHRVVAPRAGTVTAVGVAPGDQVAAGQRLCIVEIESEP